MDGVRLQDLISKGEGRAAQRLGTPFIVYRPRARTAPLASRNRVIKLDAVFVSQAGATARYGDPNWVGMFDTVYTKPGDYLSGCDGCGHTVTYFIAAQMALQSTHCVRTNRIISISRPPAPLPGAYGGMVTETATCVIEGWPSSLLAQTARISGSLPETRYGTWSALLPALPTDVFVGDVMSDDQGRTFIAASTEQSDLGWRILARQVAG